MKKTISTLFTAALAISSLASCKKDEATLTNKISTYVLVHGAWQAPYVWDAVKTELVNKGNKVIVVELPGHGRRQHSYLHVKHRCLQG
jgi:alpha-beta hydrolase superfamily lysophospholipase